MPSRLIMILVSPKTRSSVLPFAPWLYRAFKAVALPTNAPWYVASLSFNSHTNPSRDQYGCRGAQQGAASNESDQSDTVRCYPSKTGNFQFFYSSCATMVTLPRRSPPCIGWSRLPNLSRCRPRNFGIALCLNPCNV